MACAEDNKTGAHWQVYLLLCADGTLYCGITTDLPRRLEQHNGQRPGGARYTRGRRPVTLCAVAHCADRASASRLEASIKAQPRAHKEQALRSAGM